MSRSRLPLLIATAALAACWSLSAQAQWKWRDKDGIHISDRAPPPEVLDKDILQRPASKTPAPAVVTAPTAAPASAASAGTDKRLDKELEARRKKAEQEQSADTDAAQRADNCSRAKSHLAALESGQRMARYNEKGEREIIDDKARAEDIERTKAAITANCK